MPRTAQPCPGDKATYSFLLATMLFLMTIGFIAFPTRAFAEHLHDPQAREAAAIFYVGALAAIQIAWLIKWKTGCWAGDVDDRLQGVYVARLTRKYYVTTALMAAAAGLAFIRWEAGLALAGTVILFHLRAPETPQYVEEAPVVEGEK